MSSNALQQSVNLLLQIKHSLQRGVRLSSSELLQSIDKCISYIIPFVNVYSFKAKSMNRIPSNKFEEPRHKSVIIEKDFSIPSFNSEAYSDIRKSADDELVRVNKSFMRKGSSNLDISIEQILQERKNNSVLLDYFVLKYNLSINDYLVFGKKGVCITDRKVFTDLLTFDNKRFHISRLFKTQSMTCVLKEVFSQSKPSEPFILPNYQEKETRYLFAFGLPQCASISQQYYRTQTFVCFISNQFIVGELMQLMTQISKVCFEQQVKQASDQDDRSLAETISTLHGKKSYEKMEKVIEDYLQRKNEDLTSSKLFSTKSSQVFPTSIETYLERSEMLVSTIKKGKDHRTFLTLILLYCLTLSQYKIIIISRTDKRHLFSQLILGLTRSLQPLTYVYPIVGATITPHHFQFANSPVPITIGFWGEQHDFKAVRGSLLKMIKDQRCLSQQSLASETLIAVVDLQQNYLYFLQHQFKQISYLCQKIQNFVYSSEKQNISLKLSKLSQMLVQGYRSEDWMLQLAKNLKVTQMYDFLAESRKK